jgi:hypothetical protein
MVSIRNTWSAAVVILSSLLFVATSALSTPSSGLVRTTNHHRIQNIACSVVPRAVESAIISSTTTSNNKRKRTRKKCNQLGRKQQQQQQQQPQKQEQSSSSSSSYYKSHYNSRSNDDDDREDVDEWLIRSTALILGDNYNTVKENTTQPQPHEECILASSSSSNVGAGLLPSQFNSIQEYLYHAQSVMKAWTHWNSRNTIGYRRDARWTVEVILKRVLYVITTILEEGKMTTATKTTTTTTTATTTTATTTTTTETTDISELRPNLVSLVNIIIDAWANGKTVDETAVRHAESWLDFLKSGELIMKNEAQEDQDDDEEKDGEEKSSSLVIISIGPNEESYRGVVKAYIRTQKRDYLEKALKLLEEMEMSSSSSSSTSEDPNGSTSDDHPPNNNVIYPTTLTYNLILYGLANAQPSTTKNAEIAENLLQKKMISPSSSQEGEDCGCGCCCYPDSNSFRQVISAWTKTGSPDAITKSNTILNQMLNDFPKLDPDVSTFNAIMTLNLRLDKVEDVISMFHRMVSMRELGRIGTRPDIYSMNLLLKAMTSRRRRRRTQQHNDDPRQHLNEANDLLKAMEDTYHVHPDVQSFNIVIDAWSKSQLPEAVSRAEQLLDLMERKCRNDSLAARPDSYTFTSVFDSIARCSSSSSSSSEQHNYNSCFHRAEKIFHRIEKMHQDGIVVEKPTIPVYNAYLNALVSSSQDLDGFDRVESIFATMITERNANIRSYNTMLKAYAQFRSGRDGYFSRPLKAEELLTLVSVISRDNK